jgi:hypothetical protein
MTSGQKRFPIAPSKFSFARHGDCGMWVSELLPWTSKVVDEMAFIRSMHTEAINHEPAISFIQTGNQVTGRPCLGAWASYGLGSLNADLPTFVVLVARPSNTEQVQAISARLWASGYLSGEHAGVSFRTAGDPILFLNNPPGVPRGVRRSTLDGLRALNEINHRLAGDPETHTRIQQYELAFRMQASVPGLMDLSDESPETLEMYGTRGADGSYAANCLLARRLAERGVRFIHLYHRGWDHHGDLVPYMETCCGLTDRPTAALITDLKQRGMLDDTLVIFSTEFGRTPFTQSDEGVLGKGRDHNQYGFSVWLAGAGLKRGFAYGATDEFGLKAVENRMDWNDFHATILYLLGIDHERLTFYHNGIRRRLTNVHGRVIRELLA